MAAREPAWQNAQPP